MILDQSQIDEQMRTLGWVRFEGVLDADHVAALGRDAEAVYAERRMVQVRNGVAANMEGAAHHALGLGNSLDRLVGDMPLMDQIEHYFGGKTILLNFGMTLHPPGGTNYTHKPHRDIRTWSNGFRLSLNMLVMLDDFTIENGATRLLEGSHRVEGMPSADHFAQQAISLTGRAGDIILFDSLAVHSAAPNRSAALRRGLTLCFGRPFMKPHMDWPRFLPVETHSGLTPTARQLLGFHARVPTSVEDYYQPPENWAFKADQI
jgi:ectoine hydroxylase-related dioxygenase (phytanoyl-CoA dioxygenase family)